MLIIFSLKKEEETNQLKRANSKDGKDTGIILQEYGDYCLVEALIFMEDIPNFNTVQLVWLLDCRLTILLKPFTTLPDRANTNNKLSCLCFIFIILTVQLAK